MALHVQKLTNIMELEIMLKGSITGGVQLVFEGASLGLWGLVGKTATFASPVGSVTFTLGANPHGFLTYTEIKAQIEAAVAAVDVTIYERRIVLRNTTPGSISIGSAGAEPARAILGFNGKAGIYISNAPYNPYDGAAPRLLSVTPSPGQESLVVITEEV